MGYKTAREVLADLGRAAEDNCVPNLYRLLQQDTITLDAADKYATALGLHIEILWPSSEVSA
jgi:hypothetical protein